jgi:hypothetical protein
MPCKYVKDCPVLSTLLTAGDLISEERISRNAAAMINEAYCQTDKRFVLCPQYMDRAKREQATSEVEDHHKKMAYSAR